MDPFLGQIMTVGFNYAPQGWALCNGQLMPIAQNTALYSLLGTNFGGDGRTTFGLPNLQGRAAVGTGQLAGGGSYPLGQTAGAETVTLNQTQLPSHTHGATFTNAGSSLSAASQIQGTTVGPVANAVLGRGVDLGTGDARPALYAPAGSAADTALAGLNVAGTVAIAPTGGNQPVSVLNPYQAVTTIIALQGVYPPRQ